MKAHLSIMMFVMGLLAVVLVRPVSAAVFFTVNGDVNTSSSPNYTGLAVAPDAPTNTFWNPITVTGSTYTSAALKESDGTTTPTAITLSLSNVNAAVDGGGTGFTGGGPLAAADMLRDYTYQRASGGIGIFTFNNVPTGLYDLYIYSATNSLLDKSRFTIGTDVEDAINAPAGATSFVAGDNYVLFQNLSPAGGMITGTMADITGTNDAFSFNGFQLVQVPEPASAGLLAAGGLLLLRRRRVG